MILELEETVQHYTRGSGNDPDRVKAKTVEEYYHWLKTAAKLAKKK